LIEKFLLIKDFLTRLVKKKFSGEVNIRLTFNQGGIRAMKFFKETEV